MKILNWAIRPREKWERFDDIPLTNKKFERATQLIKNKDVLDCGCVGNEINSMKELEKTSHAIFMKHAKYIMGVDTWEDEVIKRKKMGFNIVYGNVENIELDKKFDVVIAGDLIEHLNNPGLFLSVANRHLKDEGLIYLCTPNAFSLNNSIKSILGIKIKVHQEHKCIFDVNTLCQLVTCYGFSIDEIYWQDYLSKKLVKYLVKINKNLANSIIVVARKKEEI